MYGILQVLAVLLTVGCSWGFRDLRTTVRLHARPQLNALPAASKAAGVVNNNELVEFWKKVESKVGKPGLYPLISNLQS